MRDNVHQINPFEQVKVSGDYGGRVTMQDFTIRAITKTLNGAEFKCCAVRQHVCALDVCDKCLLNVECKLTQPALMRASWSF